MSHLVENLLRVRQYWGESQEVFGARFGMSRTAYSHVEKGKNSMSIDMLHKLSSLTGVSMNDFVDREVSTGEILPVSEVGKFNEPDSSSYTLRSRGDELDEIRQRLAWLEKKVRELERPF